MAAVKPAQLVQIVITFSIRRAGFLAIARSEAFGRQFLSDDEPFYAGFDNYNGYAYPYYGDDDSFEVQPAPSGIAFQGSTAHTMSVQRKLSQLGYYHGPIDGIAGSETEQAIRWFQSVDKLPVTGQIDSATLQALRIG